MPERSKASLLNAATAVGMTLVNGLLGIVVTRFVIKTYGSDFNGLNSTANQIVNVLLILEGGFTMASNVALFAPLTQKNYDLVNGILSATRGKFHRIGLLFLGIGAIISAFYGLTVNSALPREFVATVTVMTVIPAAFNLYYATTYRVLLQAQQREYIINIITTCTIGLGHLSNIVMILMDGPMVMVRVNTMIFSLINSMLIVFYVKRKSKFLHLNASMQSPELIKGTNDVMVQKITGVIYNSAPIVFLSISPTGGTLLASVYAVYNNIFTMLKSILHSVIDAPRFGFGQMLAEKPREAVWTVFAQYELAAFSAIFTLLTTCCTMVMPFVELYTDGITDVNYLDTTIALFMVLITAVEMFHIPSGHLINMAGEFHISRNFQLISCVVLLFGISIGGYFWGIYGMLGSILLVALLLAFLEMGYVHIRFFPDKLPELMRLVLPLTIVGTIICVLESQLNVQISGYTSFIVYGILFVCTNGLMAAAIGALFNRRELLAIIHRLRNVR